MNKKNPYFELMATPGAVCFSAAGMLARLALPMTGIGAITMLSLMGHSYVLAGTLAASFVLTYALLSPQISRWVDRFGQSKVLPYAAAISAVGMGLVVTVSWLQGPAWLMFAGAVLAGSMPSISAMVRARWTVVFRGQPRLQTAYALETVLDEFSFIIGPPLSVGLAVAWFPQAGLLVAALVLLLGAGALAALRATEPEVSASDVNRHAHPAAPSVLRLSAVRCLVLLMLSMGAIVGSVDIVSVALAQQWGAPAWASWILAAYATGSCVAGMVFGAIQLPLPARQFLLIGAVATAFSVCLLLLAGGAVAVAATVGLAGVFFGPTMIVAMTLVEQLVAEHQLTEGLTWLLAGLNVGVALGAALSGYVVDAYGVAHGWSVAVAAGASLVLLAAVTYRQLPPVPADTAVHCAV